MMSQPIDVLPIVLAGGSGTRLWPLSRQHYPKQFLALGDGDASLLQMTIKRLQSLNMQPPLVVCNEEHRFLTAEQLRLIGIQGAKILLESEGKNTAPAIAIAALLQVNAGHDPLLLVLASDHMISDEGLFDQAVLQAMTLAYQDDLVTFGVTPRTPETGYGYIRKGDALDVGYRVAQFVEKPDLKTAEQYIASQEYLWNSGMFMFKASAYLAELQRLSPAIYNACSEAVQHAKHDHDFIRVDEHKFAECPSDSIDYAVMEKTQSAAMVELKAQWSDVGSWGALWENLSKDEHGNVFRGDVVGFNSTNCYVNTDERLIALVGVDDLAIVDTKDALLVLHKDQSQHIKKIIEQLQHQGRKELISHRVVQRPWGSYDSIEQGDRYQVKRITVQPGAKLSVQMHYHRAEHWIIVSGTAKITNGDDTFLLSENQSTYIPAGTIHCLENPGKISLEMIEVQSGAYLGEDDIVRLEDKYGRA